MLRIARRLQQSRGCGIARGVAVGDEGVKSVDLGEFGGWVRGCRCGRCSLRVFGSILGVYGRQWLHAIGSAAVLDELCEGFAAEGIFGPEGEEAGVVFCYCLFCTALLVKRHERCAGGVHVQKSTSWIYECDHEDARGNRMQDAGDDAHVSPSPSPSESRAGPCRSFRSRFPHSGEVWRIT